MDQPKIERLLRLMKMLTANNKYTVEDLSDKLDMSVRTIYRYIDTFREAGFVVKKVNGCIKLDRKSPYFKDISELVHFTDEEAYILNSAIESIDQNNLIKQNLKAKLSSVYDYKILAECVVKGSNAKNVNKLIEAIEGEKQVILRNYASANSKKVSDRIIEPFSFTTNYIQLWAYEAGVTGNSNRLFKLSRIESVEILDESWVNKSKHNIGFIDLFRITGYECKPVKIKLGMRASSLLLEEFPLAERELKKHTSINGDYWILDTQVCSYEGIGRFVLGLLDDIEILGSDEFKLFLKERISSVKF